MRIFSTLLVRTQRQVGVVRLYIRWFKLCSLKQTSLRTLDYLHLCRSVVVVVVWRRVRRRGDSRGRRRARLQAASSSCSSVAGQKRRALSLSPRDPRPPGGVAEMTSPGQGARVMQFQGIKESKLKSAEHTSRAAKSPLIPPPLIAV